MFPSPLAGPSPAKIASQIHDQYCHADKNRAANDEPLRQVRINKRIKKTNQKRSACRFDACPSLKPRFSHGERARQPRNGLNDDGVDEGSDVLCPQNRAAARHCPAKQHPATPEQVQKENAFREKNNKVSTSLRWLEASQMP